MAISTEKKHMRTVPFKEGMHVNSLLPVEIRDSAMTSSSGGGSGCGNVTGYMDSYGTITVPEAFMGCVQFLLDSGFLADGHGAAFGYRYPTKAEIGIFTRVYVDQEGLQLEWEYHDTQAAQDARKRTEKRLSNGKTSGLSIGFYVGDGKNSPEGWDYTPKEAEPDNIDYICVSPQFYNEVVPRYSKPEFVMENLQRAQQFPFVYILKRVHVFETSQTEIPANEVSLITEVRHKRTSSQLTKTRSIMAEKKDDAKRDAKREEHRDALDAVKRAFKKAKDAHNEHDDDMRGHLSRAEKALREAYAKLDDDDDDAKGKREDDDDDDDAKPKAKEAKSRAIYEAGKAK